MRRSNLAAQETDYVTKVRALVRSNPLRPRSIKTLATALGISSRQIARVFKAETHATLRSYLINEQLMRAAELIAQGVKVEAAIACAGYRSKATFYRHFKQRFGLLPKALQRTPKSRSVENTPMAGPDEPR